MKTITCIFLFCTFYCISSAQNTNISGIVNIYLKVIAADSAKGIVKLSDASNLIQYIGNNVIIIQMKGATINSTNSSSFGDIIDLGNAGRFEVAKICGQLSDTIVFENKLQNFYDPAGLVQMIVIPRYVNATVTDTLKPKSWDPVAGVGGVLAIEATGTVFINAPIYADSSGLRGGGLINHNSSCVNFGFPANDFYYNAIGTTYGHGGTKGEGVAAYISGREYGKGKQANGGGGGNNANNGGGGGSNGGGAGSGGKRSTGSCTATNPGIGGISLGSLGYSNANFRIFLGGGGGAGHQNNDVGMPGGHGAGIIYIKAQTINGGISKITANGGRPFDPTNPNKYAADSDGGGGGGGGGSIILNTDAYVGNVVIEAKGGRGSDVDADLGSQCDGPGGGGSGGVVWSKIAFAFTVSLDVSGGSNGVVLTPVCLNATNGATSGNLGFVSNGFAFPAMKDSSPVCKTILPIIPGVELTGNLSGSKILFACTHNLNNHVSKIYLQRSYTGIEFITVDERSGTQTSYRFQQEHDWKNCFYRILVVSGDGRKMFSNILLFRGRKETMALQIFPNPVNSALQLKISSERSGLFPYSITDIAGRRVGAGTMSINTGDNYKKIFLPAIQKGIYIFRMNALFSKFIKD